MPYMVNVMSDAPIFSFTNNIIALCTTHAFFLCGGMTHKMPHFTGMHTDIVYSANAWNVTSMKAGGASLPSPYHINN